MKNNLVVLLAVGFLFCSAGMAGADIIIGSWDTEDGDFDSGGWSETFWGGGEGQAGNVIAAGGDHWFMGGTLDSVTVIGANQYETIYTDAYLNLFHDGPWWDDSEGDEVTRYQSNPLGDITVTTTQSYDGAGNLTNLAFDVSASGLITSPEYPSAVSVSIAGGYDGMPTFDDPPAPIFPDPFMMSDDLDWATVETSPVPEPTTMLLLGSGLIGLAGFRRKFRKKYQNTSH